MHARMIEDGITLVIRGSKHADMKRLPFASGRTDTLYDLWLPIADWSHEDVFSYLREVGAPLPEIYQHMTNAPECATCPAWNNEKRAAYLRDRYPDLFDEYRLKLHAVASLIKPVLECLSLELEATK